MSSIKIEMCKLKTMKKVHLDMLELIFVEAWMNCYWNGETIVAENLKLLQLLEIVY